MSGIQPCSYSSIPVSWASFFPRVPAVQRLLEYGLHVIRVLCAQASVMMGGSVSIPQPSFNLVNCGEAGRRGEVACALSTLQLICSNYMPSGGLWYPCKVLSIDFVQGSKFRSPLLCSRETESLPAWKVNQPSIQSPTPRCLFWEHSPSPSLILNPLQLFFCVGEICVIYCEYTTDTREEGASWATLCGGVTTKAAKIKRKERCVPLFFKIFAPHRFSIVQI